MAVIHPYAAELASKIGVRPNRHLKIKFRTLLKGFGYYRRTPTILAQVQEYLIAADIAASISMEMPRYLDERVELTRIGGGTSANAEQTVVLPAPIAISGIESLIYQALKATVIIHCGNNSGSGFIIDSKGLIVTARHVVDDETGLSNSNVKVIINPQGTNEKELDAIVFRSHPKLDFALLWLVEEESYSYIRIGDSRNLRPAETIYAVGAPVGMPNTVTRGIISNPLAHFRGIECLQTDVAIDHGNSGGPLVNEKGEAVGINVWGIGEESAVKFSVPLDYLLTDIRTALTLGREACLIGFSCPSCGFLDVQQPTWFCRNCGFQNSESQEMKSDSKNVDGLPKEVEALLFRILSENKVNPKDIKSRMVVRTYEVSGNTGVIGILELTNGQDAMVINMPVFAPPSGRNPLSYDETMNLINSIAEIPGAKYSMEEQVVFLHVLLKVKKLSDAEIQRAHADLLKTVKAVSHDFLDAFQKIFGEDILRSSPRTPTSSKAAAIPAGDLLEDTLKACKPNVQRIFYYLIKGWQDAGGIVQCTQPGRVYLKMITQPHKSGETARQGHGFNLAVLVGPQNRKGEVIQISWGLADHPYGAYLDCIPDKVEAFQDCVSKLPGFNQAGTITKIKLNPSFTETHTEILMNAMTMLKTAEAQEP